MSDPLAELFYVHTVTVRRFTDTPRGVGGPTMATGETVHGLYQDQQRYEAGELVARGRFAYPIGVATIPTESEIDLPAAFLIAGQTRTVRVVTSAVADMGGAAGMPEHKLVEVM